MPNQQSVVQDTQSSLTAGLSGLARNGFALLLTRIELAALELSEVRTHLLQLVVIYSLAVIALCFALAGWTAVLIVSTWDSLGWKIVPIIATAFSLIAIGLLHYARTTLRQNKLSLPATINELRADRDALL